MNNHDIWRIFTSCQMVTYHTHTGHHRPVCIDVSACHFACPLWFCSWFCSLLAGLCAPWLQESAYSWNRMNTSAVIGTFFLVHPIQKYATDFKVLRLSEWQSKAIMSESSAPHLLKSSLRVVASYSRLDDGGETDLDLGNYERMMYLSLGRCGGAIWQVLSMPASRSFQENTPGISRAQGQTLPFKLLNCRDNNLTTGKIYESVIKKDCSRLKCPYCCLQARIISAKAPGAWGKVLGQNSASGPTHHWCDCWVDQPWRGSIDGESRATKFGIKHRLAVEF